MYDLMNYKTAREIGSLIEEFLYARLTYNAYAYKIMADTEPLANFAGLQEIETNADFEMSESLKVFIQSRENLIALKLNIEIHEIQYYYEYFGFTSLSKMVESILGEPLKLIQEEEAKLVNERITGAALTRREIRRKLEEIMKSNEFLKIKDY